MDGNNKNSRSMEKRLSLDNGGPRQYKSMQTNSFNRLLNEAFKVNDSSWKCTINSMKDVEEVMKNNGNRRSVSGHRDGFVLAMQKAPEEK